MDGSGNAVAAFQQVSISPGTYATYRPVGGSWQTKVQLNSSTQIVATPAGTFVAGGITVSTRLAGTSNWNQHTFSDVAKVNAAPGLAIAFALVFVMSFAVFPSAILLGQPSGATRTIAIAAYIVWFFVFFNTFVNELPNFPIPTTR